MGYQDCLKIGGGRQSNMAFKLKQKKKKRKIPSPQYFENREVRDLGRNASFQDMARTGTRNTAGISAGIYKEGNPVQYKEGLAIVEKVSRKGIHIRQYKTGKDGFPSVKAKKTKFLTVKEVEKGKVYPYFTSMPDLLFLAQFGRR